MYKLNSVQRTELVEMLDRCYDRAHAYLIESDFDLIQLAIQLLGVNYVDSILNQYH